MHALMTSIAVDTVLIGSFGSIPGRHRCSRGTRCRAPDGYTERDRSGCISAESVVITAVVRCVVSSASSEE